MLLSLKIKKIKDAKKLQLRRYLIQKKNDFFLGVIKFNLIAKNAKRIIALGGINETNISRVKLTRSKAIASISWIKKTAQVNLGRFKFY